MKVLFISPSVRQSASSRFPDGIPRSISRNFGIYPWLGLCYLSAYLQRNGFQAQVLDTEAEALTIGGIIRRIRGYRPSCIGISTMSFTFLFVLRLAREIKKHFDLPIIVGGPHISVYPREVLAHDCFDIGVIGEGEETFLELARLLSGYGEGPVRTNKLARELSRINGISFRTDGGICVTQPRELIEDIDTLPFPAVEKLPLSKYYGCNHIRPYLTMVTARGCPFHCTFCSKQHWGESFRFHSAERVVDEVEYYVKRLGIKAIDFYDDTFTVPRQRVNRIVSLIKSRNIKFDFGLMTRVDCVDRKLLNALKDAGCKVIAYGVEFGDSAIQERVNKPFELPVVQEAFRLANEAGIRTVGFFLVGHPDETESQVSNTIHMIKQLNADYVKANVLIPYPGSALYAEMLASGRLKADFWAELTKGRLLPIRALLQTKIPLRRLVSLRNYINRIPYLRLGKSNIFKVSKIKLLQDIRRTAGILLGSYFDRKV
ncbi:MAG: radical SAM protein [Candidatus Omnitrophica bacterium]|nr:radical SAM protein [Candidatus Omnitrophota bacterium]